MPAKRTLHEKFWTKVTAGDPADCWEWTGARQQTGHGLVGVSGTRTTTTAHRVSWELHHGPIPDGLVVRHRCDNPPCVNPHHLELGTRADNVRDARERSEAWRSTRGASRRNNSIDVETICARYAAGESQQAIADSMGLGQTTISRVVRGDGRFAHETIT